MLTTMIFAGILAQGPEVELGVVFHEAAGVELAMDVFTPPDASDAMPAVVVIHGGSWMGGNRADMHELARAIAMDGMVAASVSYRLAPAHKWPAMIDDVQEAVVFLEENAERFSIDPERIGATGASAGGHLALLLGTMETDSKVQAVFNIFGPTDIREDFNPGIREFVSIQVLGRPFAEAADEAASMSPVHFVDAGDAPVFSMHGTADQVVPVMQVDRLDEALRGVGIVSEVRKIEGMGHEVPMERPEVASAMAEGVAFLKKHLTD